MPDFASLKPVASQPDFSSLKPATSPPVVAQTPQNNVPGTPSYTPDPKGTFSLDNIKALPGQMMNAGKNIFNAVTGSEQGLGNEAAAAIGAPQAQTKADQLNAQHTQTLQSAVQLQRSLFAAGKDTSNVDAMIKDLQSAPAHQVSDFLPAVNDSSASVLGNAAGVAGDVLGFGTYGKAKTAAMETGKLTSKAVPSVVDVAKAAPAAIGLGVGAIASKTAELAPKAVLGSGARETLAQMANPEAKAFLPVAKGGAAKTFNAVVNSTRDAIGAFVSKSKSELAAVKDAIPTGVKVDQSKIAQTVNDGILKGVQSGADYKGIKGPVEQLFKTPEAVIQSGILNTEEAAKVKGMVDVIKGWSDTSARGVLNLKEQLAPFYKDGLTGSNKILGNIQNGLKDLVAEVHPQIKPALKAASDNIDLANQFSRHLLGSNETTGETKLLQLAKNLDNPALKGYQHILLDQLKAATGHDIMPQLQGYNDYLKLFGKGLPSKTYTIGKGVVTSPLVEGAAGLGTLGLLKEGFSKLGM